MILSKTHRRAIVPISRICAGVVVLLIGITAVARAQEAGRDPQKHVMWRVSSDSGVVYLVGSVHALPEDVYPLDSIFVRSFDSCARLALELDLGPSGIQAMQSTLMMRGMYTGKKGLAENISPETYALLTKTLKEQGMDVRLFGRFKPWVVGMLVMSFSLKQAGMAAENGLDIHFSRLATERNYQIAGLETVDDQIAVFDSMSPALQEEFLREQLLGDTAAVEALRGIVTAWRTADITALEGLLKTTSESPEMYERLVVRRNRNWMRRIESYLHDPQRTMIVVGALHLLGSDGLVAMLAARGYHVEQL